MALDSPDRVQPKARPVPDPLPPAAPRLAHSRLEDGYALVIGCALVVQGLLCLRAAGLVTGGVAGIALLLSYVIHWPPGLLFTLLNLPFFALAWGVMGRAFTAKTMLVNLCVLGFSLGAPAVFRIAEIDPLFAALFGGTVIGMGILSLARHHAGVGGTGVVTLWLQRRRGWNPGISQIAIDAGVLALSATVVDAAQLALSAVSAAAMSAVLIVFHRPGRYGGY